MKLLNLTQGSPEWHKERLASFTASEAPAMMGKSKYMTRTELLELKKTGIQKEVSPQTQRIFDKGHATEAMARPIIENRYTEEFFPVTGVIEVDGLRILASFDGINMMEDTVFEHKLLNNELAKKVLVNDLPEHYFWQLEQQLMVSGAERAIFVVSDGTEEAMHIMEYFPVDGRREQLIAGWKQFAIDLETFEPAKTKVKHETKAMALLPSLAITINGEVSSSNLEVYKSTATKVIASINTDLSLDEHFAQAEVDIKFCANAEKELEAVKNQALSNTADIDMLFKTINHLSEQLKSKRLTLNKLVKTQKEQIKKDIVVNARELFKEHVSIIHESLNGLKIPVFDPDFAGAIKGKRNLSSMRDAVDTELATSKIIANESADLMRTNLAQYENKAIEHKFLFNDIQQIITNDAVSFAAIIDSRISQHKESEEKRLEAEREQIRIQEQRKAEQVERQKLEAERQRIRVEEQAKAKAEEASRIEAEKIELEPVKQVVAPVAEKPKPVQVEKPEKMVTITVAEYDELVADSNTLIALRLAGVSSWIGYVYAIESLNEQVA